MRQLDPLYDAVRRADIAVLPQSRTRCTQRAGNDELIARAGARASWNTVGLPNRRNRDRDHGSRDRVATPNRDAGFSNSCVEPEYVVELGLAGDAEADEQRPRPRARGGEIADVDGGRAETELLPRKPVEAEVNSLDERILCDDEPVPELRRVVLDLFGEPAALQLGQQAELAELRQPHVRELCEQTRHSSPPARRRHPRRPLRCR